RLPRRDDPRRAQWLENSRRRDPAGGGRWDPSSKYIYFCSQHFESSCFELVGYRCGWGSTAETGGATGGIWGATGEPGGLQVRETPRYPRTPSGVGAPPGVWLPPGIPGPPRCWALPRCWGLPLVLDPPRYRGPLRYSRGPPAVGVPPGVGDSPGVGDPPGVGLPPAPPTPAAPAAPPGPPGPPSPSLFMLRLPPRAGSYIQSEHSYQVGSALLWKR
ncbi:THAP7 protein, partial [Hypocryptadius cinnamomeus]|nr:THAP7 protein [Hypocryptadius cinnamomeus]